MITRRKKNRTWPVGAEKGNGRKIERAREIEKKRESDRYL